MTNKYDWALSKHVPHLNFPWAIPKGKNVTMIEIWLQNMIEAKIWLANKAKCSPNMFPVISYEVFWHYQ